MICANLNGDLTPGYDRYRPFRAVVHNASAPAFVFVPDAPQVANLEQLLKDTHTPYQKYTIGKFVVYKPAHSLPLPHYKP